MSATPTTFPFKLRISHEGDVSLRLDRPGRTIRFDPATAPSPDEICLLTWHWPEHLDGVALAVDAGARPTVVSSPEVLQWLKGRGEVDAHEAPCTVDGVGIRSWSYQPIPYATPHEAARKAAAGLKSPGSTLGRLVRRIRYPSADPVIFELTFPNGERLVHLNHALHKGTDPAWLDEVTAELSGADYLIVGVDYEEHEAFLRLIGRFEPRQLFVTSLVQQIRKKVGLPTKIITPLVDELVTTGMNAYVLPLKASLRFE